MWRTRAYGDFWSYCLVAEGAVDIACEPEPASTTWPRWCPIFTGPTAVSPHSKLDSPLQRRRLNNGALHDAALDILVRARGF